MAHGNYGRHAGQLTTHIKETLYTIEVLYEEMLWKLYKITTKAFTTFPKLHNAWTHWLTTRPYKWVVYNWFLSGQINLSTYETFVQTPLSDYFSLFCTLLCVENMMQQKRLGSVRNPCSFNTGGLWNHAVCVQIHSLSLRDYSPI